MKCTFKKYGVKQGSFVGDAYEVVYDIQAETGENMRVSFIHGKGTVTFGGRTVMLNPNYRRLDFIGMLKDHSIVENGQTIGKITNPAITFFTPTIIMENGPAYKLKNWNGPFDPTTIYRFELWGEREVARYHARTEKRFDAGHPGPRYVHMHGEIDFTSPDMLMALLGLLLLELMIDRQE